MPIRFSDLAPALLGGTAAALGGPMAARPIRRATQYADDARSLKAQHLQNMEDWEEKFEENGRNQQALDYFLSIDAGDSPFLEAAKTAAKQGDLEGARRFYGQDVTWKAQRTSDLMPPTPEQIEEIRGGLQPGDSRTVSYRGGSQTVHGPEKPGNPRLRYYTAQKPDGQYAVVFDEDQQRVIKEVLVDKVDTKSEQSAQAPDAPAELSDVAYRRLLRKRALWGKPTGNAEVDALSQEEAQVELLAYDDPELAAAKAKEYSARNVPGGQNLPPGAPQSPGGSQTSTPPTPDAAKAPSSPSAAPSTQGATSSLTVNPDAALKSGLQTDIGPDGKLWVRTPQGWTPAQ